MVNLLLIDLHLVLLWRASQNVCLCLALFYVTETEHAEYFKQNEILYQRPGSLRVLRRILAFLKCFELVID